MPLKGVDRNFIAEAISSIHGQLVQKNTSAGTVMHITVWYNFLEVIKIITNITSAHIILVELSWPCLTLRKTEFVLNC